MTPRGKILTAAGFVLILLSLGTADLLLTQSTLRFPQREGVAKHAGPDVPAVAASQGFAVAETTERNLLTTVLPVDARAALSARVLLKDDDRAATVAWIDARDVKDIFTALKKALRPTFSPQLADLIDETQSQPGKPPRDVLSFRDPAIHPERLLFVRIRERLYEFHVGEGREREIDTVIDVLTE